MDDGGAERSVEENADNVMGKHGGRWESECSREDGEKGKGRDRRDEEGRTGWEEENEADGDEEEKGRVGEQGHGGSILDPLHKSNLASAAKHSQIKASPGKSKNTDQIHSNLAQKHSEHPRPLEETTSPQQNSLRNTNVRAKSSPISFPSHKARSSALRTTSKGNPTPTRCNTNSNSVCQE